MIPVIIETPYTGDEVPLHLRYLRACMRDCLLRDESPYAAHHLCSVPGVLAVERPEERELGVAAKLAWRQYAVKSAFYTDLGWSAEMVMARALCDRDGWNYEIRFLEPGWLVEHLSREAAAETLDDWLLSLGG